MFLLKPLPSGNRAIKGISLTQQELDEMKQVALPFLQSMYDKTIESVQRISTKAMVDEYFFHEKGQYFEDLLESNHFGDPMSQETWKGICGDARRLYPKSQNYVNLHAHPEVVAIAAALPQFFLSYLDRFAGEGLQSDLSLEEVEVRAPSGLCPKREMILSFALTMHDYEAMSGILDHFGARLKTQVAFELGLIPENDPSRWEEWHPIYQDALGDFGEAARAEYSDVLRLYSKVFHVTNHFSNLISMADYQNALAEYPFEKWGKERIGPVSEDKESLLVSYVDPALACGVEAWLERTQPENGPPEYRAYIKGNYRDRSILVARGGFKPFLKEEVTGYFDDIGSDREWRMISGCPCPNKVQLS